MRSQFLSAWCDFCACKEGRAGGQRRAAARQALGKQWDKGTAGQRCRETWGVSAPAWGRGARSAAPRRAADVGGLCCGYGEAGKWVQTDHRGPRRGGAGSPEHTGEAHSGLWGRLRSLCLGGICCPHSLGTEASAGPSACGRHTWLEAWFWASLRFDR